MERINEIEIWRVILIGDSNDIDCCKNVLIPNAHNVWNERFAQN